MDPSNLESPYRAWSIGIGGSILSSPLAIDGMIVFGCNDTHVYAVDKNGDKLWSYKTGDMVFSSPTCYEDFIVIGSSDGYLYTFSINGELKWKFLTGGKVWSTPTIADGIVYFGSNNGMFYALSLEDGKELWRYQASTQEFFHSASAFNDSLVFSNFGGSIFCISKTGKLIWKFLCGDYNSQNPLAVDKNNLELSGAEKRSFAKFPEGNKCKILAGSSDGYFRCLDAEDGRVVWKTFVNRMGASSPLIYKNLVCFGSYDGRVYSIDANNGAVRWKLQTGSKIVSSPVCKSNILYIGSSDHNLYALSCDTGELMWRFLTDGEIISSPAVDKGVVYFGGWDCHLYALSVKDKELLWKFRTSMGVPSYIKKPQMVAEEQCKAPQDFMQPVTLKSYQISRSNYSLQTGELTNTFYGSPVAYKMKSSYETSKNAYKK
ncbi:MAG: PQQ-binding-like beta-propeller repeat protein [Candidatus Aenigmarchaeota archaeon]|nr:PQQ-binding-like beta-propeller repeat protein [Candidatus Aenigmarchaeota archaeon]